MLPQFSYSIAFLLLDINRLLDNWATCHINANLEFQELHDLALEASKIGDDLGVLLQKSKAKGKQLKLDSLRAALLAIWNKDAIGTLARRLEHVRNDLQFRVLVAIKKKIDVDALRQDSRFTALDMRSQDIINLILSNHNDLKSQNLSLIDQQSQIERLALQRHKEILAAIQSAQKPFISKKAPP